MIRFGGGLVELGGQFLVLFAKVKQGFSTLGEDGLDSSGVDKIGEKCLQQIRELKVNIEIPEGKSISEAYPREHPHTLPDASLERLFGQPLEVLLGLNLVQHRTEIRDSWEGHQGSKRSMAKKSPSWRDCEVLQRVLRNLGRLFPRGLSSWCPGG